MKPKEEGEDKSGGRNTSSPVFSSGSLPSFHCPAFCFLKTSFLCSFIWFPVSRIIWVLSCLWWYLSFSVLLVSELYMKDQPREGVLCL